MCQGSELLLRGHVHTGLAATQMRNSRSPIHAVKQTVLALLPRVRKEKSALKLVNSVHITLTRLKPLIFHRERVLTGLTKFLEA